MAHRPVWQGAVKSQSCQHRLVQSSGYSSVELPRVVSRRAAIAASDYAARLRQRVWRRPGRQCSDRVRIRFHEERSRSCVSYHQKSACIRGIDQAILSKARLFICPNGAGISWIRIGDNARRTPLQQTVDEGANKSGAMTTIQHVCFADKLIDAPGAGGLWAQAGTIPCIGVVALQIAERPALTCNDELIHRRFMEIRTDNIELLIWVAPPPSDMWLSEPSLDQRQVVGGHGTKLVHAAPRVRRCS